MVCEMLSLQYIYFPVISLVGITAGMDGNGYVEGWEMVLFMVGDGSIDV
jgi:hypothetical protein